MATNCKEYDFSQIEPHWQSFWAKDATFQAEDTSEKPKQYILDMFPYPSGAGLHLGHVENYTASDTLRRFKKAQGYNTLHPMGWDAFGLPTEQYAIKTGTHPAETTKTNVSNYIEQLEELGFVYNWDREINTTDPGYFKWTQWIFLQLFKHGLAYVDEKPVWWCPALGTVLANEEIIDGKSERGSHPVERRALRQWVLRITAYAEKLLEGLDDLDWPDSTKRLQKNWIGRSEGAEVDFALEDLPDEKLRIFTTRPDTLFGVTYMVLSPEHPLVDALVKPEQKAAIDAYRTEAARKSDLERAELAKVKTGVFSGAYAINPVNGDKIPIWVADYVLMSYGTGAIMAVPAHDERDYEFAKTFDLPIKKVITQEGEDPELPFVANGFMTNSGEFDGLTSQEGKKKITAALAEKEQGEATINYKLRDWLFSRQRYWGEPFPIFWVSPEDYEKVKAFPESPLQEFLPEEPMRCQMNGKEYIAVPVPSAQLPLKLPEVASYEPSGTGESPLANATDWLNVYLNIATGTTVPESAGPQCENCVLAQRETNTMPQWAGSCWYYLRFIDPKNDQQIIDPDKEAYWGVPDWYIGGAEHAVLHLLYARFWHRFLYDIGVLKTAEPFKKLFHQGIILGEIEYTLFLDKAGEPVSFDQVDTDNFDGTTQSLTESDVTKQKVSGKDVYTWNENPDIQIDGRAYKMSKSRGNVANPKTIIDEHGADALRMYIMFLGPLEEMKPWSTHGIEGISRFLRKVWREYIDAEGQLNTRIADSAEENTETLKVLHQTIKKVTEDYETLQFNTAISQLMICLNHLGKQETFNKTTANTFIQLLAPLAPHIAEELWERLGNTGSIVLGAFPKFDASKLVSDTLKIIVQVNGKLRGELHVDKSIEKDDILQQAKALERVQAQIEGKNIVKEIYVPGRIVNIVAK